MARGQCVTKPQAGGDVNEGERTGQRMKKEKKRKNEPKSLWRTQAMRRHDDATRDKGDVTCQRRSNV
jgi:hypothetical protein